MGLRNSKFIFLGIIAAITVVVFYAYDIDNNEPVHVSKDSARPADDKPVIQDIGKSLSPDKIQIPKEIARSESDAVKSSQNVKSEESSETDTDDIALDDKAVGSQGVSEKLLGVNSISRNVSMISMKTPELTPVAGFTIMKSSKAEIEKLKKSQLK